MLGENLILIEAYGAGIVEIASIRVIMTSNEKLLHVTICRNYTTYKPHMKYISSRN